MLLHDLKDPVLPWPWHADEPWLCPFSHKPISYIVGFATEAEAISYGKRYGWLKEITPNPAQNSQN